MIVADVNISDNNELNVYSVIGNPKTGKWLAASLLDRRGFTSWSHPWSRSWGETVHSLWNWGDATYDKENPNMGLFYVDWNPAGFGKKMRVISGLIESYDAAVDSKTGRLLVVTSKGERIFFSMRDVNGVWTKPTRLDPLADNKYSSDVSVQSVGDGTFIVRSSGKSGGEWRLTPVF